jgi:hypothetical protein
MVALMLCTVLVTRVFDRNGSVGDAGTDSDEPDQTAVARTTAAEMADLAASAEPTAPDGGPDAGELAEVAAIAVALGAYMRGAGRELSGHRMRIDDASFEVEVGDHSLPSIPVTVNGHRFLASLGSGAPGTVRTGPAVITRRPHALNATGWRSAYTIAQGGYWDRRGWGKGR